MRHTRITSLRVVPTPTHPTPSPSRPAPAHSTTTPPHHHRHHALPTYTGPERQLQEARAGVPAGRYRAVPAVAVQHRLLLLVSGGGCRREEGATARLRRQGREGGAGGGTEPGRRLGSAGCRRVAGGLPHGISGSRRDHVGMRRGASEVTWGGAACPRRFRWRPKITTATRHSLAPMLYVPGC